MLNGIKDTKMKFGPVSKQFSPDGVNLFNHDLYNVRTEIGYLIMAHSTFLNLNDDNLIDVSFDDIENIKQELTSIERKYFVNPV